MKAWVGTSSITNNNIDKMDANAIGCKLAIKIQDNISLSIGIRGIINNNTFMNVESLSDETSYQIIDGKESPGTMSLVGYWRQRTIERNDMHKKI